MEDPVCARILGCQSLHDFQILVSLTDAKPCARSFFSFLHRPKQENELRRAFALANCSGEPEKMAGSFGLPVCHSERHRGTVGDFKWKCLISVAKGNLLRHLYIFFGF